MRGIALAFGLLCASLAASACGGSTASPQPSPPTASSTVPATGAEANLRTTALAWAKAYLTGTALEQLALQGPECVTGGPPKTTPAILRAAAAELQRQRARLAHYAGASAATIQSKIVDVIVRNMTANTGEAEVRYDLPVSATGNDNWVTYELIDGTWKVQDCRAPFGGSSASSSVSAPTP